MSDLLFDDIEMILPEMESVKPKAKAIKTINKNLYRKAYSEVQLLDLVGCNFQDGESWHVISGGDIDSLSYLSLILRAQPLDYCLLSTWCMAMDDVQKIAEWLQTGKIKKLDCYVGEIFPGSYSREYNRLKEVTKGYGRICVFRNHSKVYAGYGSKFHFAIESSANINANPRTEQTCITIGEDIYEFYKDYFDGIQSFEKVTKSSKMKL